MGDVTIIHSGDFSLTERFLNRILNREYLNVLMKYGEAGVAALSDATPKRTGKTAASWEYEIEKNSREIVLRFINNNIQNGVNIAIILQYGHGTSRGGYVQGRDYITPALRPILDSLAADAWKEVIG